MQGSLPILVQVTLHASEGSPVVPKEIIEALLEALVTANRAYLRVMPTTPKLYVSGVRYRPEPKGIELFADIGHVLRQGFADCDDLCAWRVAELRESREDPRAAVKVIEYRRGPKTYYHVKVQRGSGAIEDPSAVLGMTQVA